MENNLPTTTINQQSLFYAETQTRLTPHNSSFSDLDFSEIYMTYYSKLVRFATNFVIYKEDAENIIQDIFVNLWEERDSLSYIISLNAYIYKLTKNRCIDYLKHKITREKYVGNIQSAFEQELKLQSLEDFDIEIASEENIEKIITDAINILPNRCREIFLLSRYEGLKYKEISERLNLSVNTVETQMGIALKKLRGKLKSYLLP